MEKPGKKLKKVMIIGGTTGAVYAGFQYLLPLVAPFLLGYVVALILRPSARFLSYRIKIRWKGKYCHLPVGAAGGVEFFIVLVLAGAGVYWAGAKLCQEGRLFWGRLPFWVEELDRRLTTGCSLLENILGLSRGQVSQMVSRFLADLVHRCREMAMPVLMTNSLVAVRWIVGALVGGIVLFLAVVLSLQEMDDLRWRRDQSLFRREFALIGSRIVQTGKAWFKTQGIILLIITILCIFGMFVIGNPYYIMAGLGIGVLDALPLFGTGTVLLPWALLCMASGKWKRGVFLIGLYAICYLLREFLESRLMSEQVGLSPLETLAAVYVGLRLFGFWGLILGPLGLLLIEDMVEAWSGEK